MPHGRRLVRVGFQEGLLDPFGALGQYRVRDLTGAVVITGFADVVALFGVFGEAVPGLLQQIHHVELGDALLDPPGEQLGGHLGLAPVAGGELERLVRGQQPHAGLFQAVLDGDPVEHMPSGAVDALADHVVESPVGTFGFGQQVSDAAVAGNGNIEQLVEIPAPTGVEVHAAGFHVVEVADDHGLVRQRALAA
ncbi:hypothetical protein AMYBAR_002755 [Amycolatopsis bartoniae]|nr:hypothetical protein [Amycolatopsis bartoniae]